MGDVETQKFCCTNPQLLLHVTLSCLPHRCCGLFFVSSKQGVFTADAGWSKLRQLTHGSNGTGFCAFPTSVWTYLILSAYSGLILFCCVSRLIRDRHLPLSSSIRMRSARVKWRITYVSLLLWRTARLHPSFWKKMSDTVVPLSGIINSPTDGFCPRLR